jgi:hypothetical protein
MLKRIIKTKVTKLELAKFSSFGKVIRQVPAISKSLGKLFGKVLSLKFGH